MLNLDIKPLFKLRGIPKPYTTLVKAGISPQSAAKIVRSETRIFRLDHIEIICGILNCTPNDLLSWSQNKGTPIAETHALHQLKREKKDFTLQDKLSSLTLEQLNLISEIVTRQITDK